MKRNSAAFVCLFVLAAASGTAATFVIPSDRELVEKSRVIVIGTVQSSYAQLDSADAIETVTELSLEQVVKGTLTLGGVLRIYAPGGVVGNRAELVVGAPQFVVGERVLLFLVKDRHDRWQTVDLALGKFRFAQSLHGDPLLLREESDVVGWDAAGRVHVEKPRRTERFIQFIRETATGRRSGIEYLSEATELVPTGSESLGLTPMAAVQPSSFTMNLPHPTLPGVHIGNRWPTFGAGVPFRKVASQNLAGAPNGGVDAIRAAITSWNRDCGSNTAYVYVGTTASTTGGTASDNVNSVLFNDPNNEIGGSWSGSGVIAFARTRFSSTHQFAGETYWTPFEGDIVFQDGFPGTHLALLVAMTHEFGHTLGFRHSDKHTHLRDASNFELPCDPVTMSCSSSAVMTASVSSSFGANLQAWDKEAVRTIYPGGTCRGDFNFDSHNDLIWRNYSTGAVNVWFLSGTTYIGGQSLFTVTDPNWRIEGSGDFNGDAKPDLVWRHYSSGAVNVWFLDGTTYIGGQNLFSVTDLNWQIEGVADFNDDGKADLIWRNYATGAVNVWFLDGTTYIGGQNLFNVTDPNWRLEGTGDFNGDGLTDLIWRNYSSGDVNVWFLDGTTYIGGANLFRVTDPNWRIQAIEDYDGDEDPDLVWRNYSTGEVNVWLMDGTTYLSGRNLFDVDDLNWEISAPR